MNLSVCCLCMLFHVCCVLCVVDVLLCRVLSVVKCALSVIVVSGVIVYRSFNCVHMFVFFFLLIPVCHVSRNALCDVV